MQRLAGRSIFSLGKRLFDWEDVVLAAYLWGEIPALERRIASELAAQSYLADMGKEVSEETVESAASRWRYEHDLISGDDTESWLISHDLTVDEWLGYFRRVESAKRRTEKAPPRRYRPTSDAVAAVLFAEAVCSGTIAAVTARLAARAAIADRAASEGTAQRPAPQTKVRTIVDRLPTALKQRGLFGLNGPECVKRAGSIAMMSLVFDRFTSELAAPAPLEREIEAHALEWTHVRCRTLAFPSEEPAREAVLLMREDGLPITEAATLADAKVLDADYVLEDVGGALKDRLVGAQAGDIIGPVKEGDGFLVASVVGRIEPSRGDRSVRERARDRIVKRTVQAEVDKRIRWHERF